MTKTLDISHLYESVVMAVDRANRNMEAGDNKIVMSYDWYILEGLQFKCLLKNGNDCPKIYDLEINNDVRLRIQEFVNAGGLRLVFKIYNKRKDHKDIGDVDPITEYLFLLLNTKFDTLDDEIGTVPLLIYYLTERHDYGVDISWMSQELTTMGDCIESHINVIITDNITHSSKNAIIRNLIIILSLYPQRRVTHHMASSLSKSSIRDLIIEFRNDIWISSDIDDALQAVTLMHAIATFGLGGYISSNYANWHLLRLLMSKSNNHSLRCPCDKCEFYRKAEKAVRSRDEFGIGGVEESLKSVIQSLVECGVFGLVSTLMSRVCDIFGTCPNSDIDFLKARRFYSRVGSLLLICTANVEKNLDHFLQNQFQFDFFEYAWHQLLSLKSVITDSHRLCFTVFPLLQTMAVWMMQLSDASWKDIANTQNPLITGCVHNLVCTINSQSSFLINCKNNGHEGVNGDELGKDKIEFDDLYDSTTIGSVCVDFITLTTSLLYLLSRNVKSDLEIVAIDEKLSQDRMDKMCDIKSDNPQSLVANFFGTLFEFYIEADNIKYLNGDNQMVLLTCLISAIAISVEVPKYFNMSDARRMICTPPKLILDVINSSSVRNLLNHFNSLTENPIQSKVTDETLETDKAGSIENESSHPSGNCLFAKHVSSMTMTMIDRSAALVPH